MGKISKIRKFDTGNESYDVQCDLGNRKRFTEKDLVQVVPKTNNQKLALELCGGNSTAVGLIGSAGVGKSYLALYSALQQVFDPSLPYEKIVVARSAVATRDIGFLKGDLDQKSEVFELPYHSLARELMPRFNSAYDHLKSLGYLEFTCTSYLRGLTYHDTIIIVDEIQNLSRHEIYTILTRLGENSKVIFCGDSKQTDLKANQSGFKYLIELSEKLQEGMCSVVQFTVDDIVRSEFVKAVIMADEDIG